MRRVVVCLSLALVSACGLSGETASAPQTARQALLEMFFSKTTGTLVKHLPAVTLAALEKSGALTSLQMYSSMATQLQTQGKTVQTFETGSVLLTGQDPKTGDKFEVTVENDALRADQDDIELSFQVYKNGQVERTPFMPQMTFSMKQEEKVWKLNEISVTIHVPLADPDFLKALTEKMTPHAGTTAYAAHPEISAQPTGSDAQVIAAMRSILTAEVTYAATYPNAGYTCTLSNLDGFGGGEPNEHQAMLINSGLASGKRYGYVFSLAGCGGSPSISFQLSAAPSGNSFGRKSFCTDQTAVIRASADGSAATCLASGVAAQ